MAIQLTDNDFTTRMREENKMLMKLNDDKVLNISSMNKSNTEYRIIINAPCYLFTPELYSRIQSGIVVFEKLTPEIVKEIMVSKMKRFISRLKEENNIIITISDNVVEKLANESKATNGREIMSTVENSIGTAITEKMIDENITSDATIKIVDYDVLTKEFKMEVGHNPTVSRIIRVAENEEPVKKPSRIIKL